MATQKHTHTKRQMHTIQPAISYLPIYSPSHKWIALMFWAFRQSQSALLCVCVVTRSLEMALAPSSQGRNHLVERQAHTHTHTRIHTHTQNWAGRIWIALRQTFLTQVPYSRFLLCPEHTLTHIWRYSTCTEIPFCQLSAPDQVTIKDAALQLNTASKSQGKESWEKHLFLSSMRDHTGGKGLRQIG